MSKFSSLIKNTGILAIGSFSSKLLVFLMVPLYTAVLSTGDYGAYDVIYSTVSLLVPVLTLNISDALLRFPMEGGADVPAIARIGLLLTLVGSALALVVQIVPGAPWSSFAGIGWLGPLFAATSLYQSLTLLARGMERMRDIAVAGVVSSVMTVLLNVLLLVFVGMGLDGYFISSVVGLFLPSVWLIVRMRGSIFGRAKGGLVPLASKMVRYSLPLAATTVGWWLINASDRYIVLWFCGVDANGLYSAAYKIPSILNTVAGIFIQAWQVAAVKGFDPVDSDGFLRKTYRTVEAGIVLLCSLMIPLSPLVARFMFSGDFFMAWEYVPLLLVYVVLNTMAGMWGPFFSAAYDPGPMATSTFAAGAVNVLAGIPLVAIMGVYGACLSSVIAGLVNWGIRALKARGHIEVSFAPGRSLLLYGILALQAATMVLGSSIQIAHAVEAAVPLALVYCCRREIGEVGVLLLKAIRR